ncbi:transcriptional regulator, TetR family [Paenibacillus sp. UNC496MF]|uniref:TetR/AcrR family transcriptional regulator n=1 Tax=Paenibacillus sp. UNC496MF TaxID=1502753 RepID=UPI0008F20A1B|nr:TetR/AcrR family transcriptional regulator [Paenibacillus sp. UNC496MF]SFI38086.1 transcriptional regulator, TetR family [Paenibacillus sp. UNC496MF]
MNAEAKLDRRVVKTREAINKAFLELFAEKEFQQITINDISDRANVNRGTVYLHYADKYDLLDKNIDSHLNRLLAFCGHGGAASTDDIPALGSELKPVFDYLAANYPFFSAMFANQRTSVFRERMLAFVAGGVRRKLETNGGAARVDHELHAEFMASAFVGIVEWWIRRAMPHSPEAMAEQLSDLFAKNVELD